MRLYKCKKSWNPRNYIPYGQKRKKQGYWEFNTLKIKTYVQDINFTYVPILKTLPLFREVEYMQKCFKIAKKTDYSVHKKRKRELRKQTPKRHFLNINTVHAQICLDSIFTALKSWEKAIFKRIPIKLLKWITTRPVNLVLTKHWQT